MRIRVLPSVSTTIPARLPLTILEQEALRVALRMGALVMILSMAVALRVIHLNALGYNSDEAVYAGQAAAIAQIPVLKDIFPVFRAHPLLFQFVVGAGYSSFGLSDWLGRVIAVAVGTATVFLAYKLGSRLYGHRTGILTALLLAIMPYHVVVTRQVLLDGPMVFFTTLALYMMVRFAESEQRANLIACGACMGLAFLAKEVSIVLLGAIYAFLALSPEIRVRISAIVQSLVAMAVVMLAFPLSVILAGGGGEHRTQQYLVWQLFRRANHTWDFYPSVVPPAIGILVLLAALAGLWKLRHHRSWREKLLVVWIIVPVIFFQIWPTKGFQYLLPIAPPIAVLAARALALWPYREIRRWRIPARTQSAVVSGIVALSLLVPSWLAIQPTKSDTFLAGSGGVPGGREAGLWINHHIPRGATFMTIGPSMANIIKFYGQRDAYGLSISPNPLHRNPSYEPILNPDFRIRTGEIQYLVWDSFSAARSDFFSEHLLGYAQKYRGRVIYVETVTVQLDEDEAFEKPIIIIYEVRS